MRWERALGLLLRGVGAARASYRAGLQGRIVARTHELTLPRPVGAPPLRVAFASDFHAGPTTDPRLIRSSIDAVLAAEPDIILLGGDFVAFDAHDVDELVPLLAELRAPLGVHAVLGNHDLDTDGAHVTAALQAAGVHLLTNRALRLPAPHDDVWLLGLDDPIIGNPRPEPVFDAADRHDAGSPSVRLVLMHAPDGLIAIGDRAFDLAFCGHTHGGQIALPWGTPIFVPRGRLSRRFARGIHELRNGGRLIVSNGVGCTTVPVRLFAQPEVHVVTIGG